MDRLGLNQFKGDDKYDLLALYKSWISNYDEEDSESLFSNTMSHCEYYETSRD